jgi:hypothetical protein
MAINNLLYWFCERLQRDALHVGDAAGKDVNNFNVGPGHFVLVGTVQNLLPCMLFDNQNNQEFCQH